MVAGMLQEHLQKIANITLERTPSQAMELLEAEPVNTEKKKDQDHTREEPTTNQIEDDQRKRYREMPEVDVRMVREERIHTWNNEADPSPHKNKEWCEPPCDPGVRDCTKSALDAKEVAPEEGLLWCDTQSIRKGPEEGVSWPRSKL